MYTVSNTFEIFGSPGTEKHATLSDAQEAAYLISHQIVELFFPLNVQGRVVVEPRDGQPSGYSVEVELLDRLADMSEQMGGIPFEDVVEEVRELAVEIAAE